MTRTKFFYFGAGIATTASAVAAVGLASSPFPFLSELLNKEWGPAVVVLFFPVVVLLVVTLSSYLKRSLEFVFHQYPQTLDKIRKENCENAAKSGVLILHSFSYSWINGVTLTPIIFKKKESTKNDEEKIVNEKA